MSTNQDSEYFLDRETGLIEWVSDMAMTKAEQQEIYDRLDKHGYYRFPTQYEIRDYDIMEEFVGTLSGAAYERLANALCGCGDLSSEEFECDVPQFPAEMFRFEKRMK